MRTVATYNLSKLSQLFTAAPQPSDYLLITAGQYSPSTEEPFRTDTYVLAFLRKGSLGVSVGLNSGVVTGPCLVAIGPYMIRSIDKVEDDPEVELLFFKEQFFLANQANVFALLQYNFFEANEQHVIPLSGENCRKFNNIYALLKQATVGNHPHEAALVRNYIDILLCEADAAAPEKTQVALPALLTNFRSLLAKHILRERSVRFYAGLLHVTPKHLSEVVKAQTGRTAGEWIDQSVILEAKVLLQQKELSISQVADALHFSDQSVFGKFFKVNTGVSPLAYRQSLA